MDKLNPSPPHSSEQRYVVYCNLSIEIWIHRVVEQNLLPFGISCFDYLRRLSLYLLLISMPNYLNSVIIWISMYCIYIYVHISLQLEFVEKIKGARPEKGLKGQNPRHAPPSSLQAPLILTGLPVALALISKLSWITTKLCRE